MNKLFTLCVSLLLLGTGVYAQEAADGTFQFVDAEGNAVADGSVITVSELNDEGQMVVPLFVKNMSGQRAAVSMYETIDQLPNGEWQTCAFGNCMILSETGYSPKNIVPDDYNASIQTEWIPAAEGYASWEATLQIHVFNIVSKSQFGVVTEVAGNEVIGYGPKVTVRFEYKKPEPQPEKTKLWWGYVGADDVCNGLGIGKAETYDCAVFFPASQEIAAGKTIHSVRFQLLTTNVTNVKVWIAESLPTTVDKALQVVNVVKIRKGVNDVPLTTPYTIGSKGVYVGYSFTIPALQTQEDSYPVPVTGTDLTSALLLRTSSTSWSDLNGQGFGRLYLQVLLEGVFPYKNAASFASSNLGEAVAVLGDKGAIDVPLTNKGTVNLNSIDYTVTTDGVTSEERHLDLPSAVALGGTTTVSIQVEADDVPGQKEKTLTITKVNGVANEQDGQTTQLTMSTLSELVHRGVAVEEYTGTTCGWCPRGIVGMEKMRRELGDSFVGIAIHRYASSTSSDAMYISSYSHVSFGGAPSCRINRGAEVDPYYGSGYDILDDLRAVLAIPAKVGVEVTGVWNADSTKVEATATLSSVLPDCDYKIEYVLIADSLKGTGTAWNQTNYYYQYTASQVPDDLAVFVKNGKYGKSSVSGLIFNDVAIAVAKSTQTTAPGVLTLGEPVTNTYTLSMPTNATLLKAIKKERVAVVALVIDKKTNRIANAAKFYMPGYDASSAIHDTGVAERHSQVEARYSLDGRQLPAGQKGLSIVRMADGTIRKVVVK